MVCEDLCKVLLSTRMSIPHTSVNINLLALVVDAIKAVYDNNFIYFSYSIIHASKTFQKKHYFKKETTGEIEITIGARLYLVVYFSKRKVYEENFFILVSSRGTSR